MTPATISENRDRTFRAHAGKRVFEVAFRDSRLLVNGEAVSYAFAPVAEGYYSLLIDGRSHTVAVAPAPGGRLRITLDGRPIEVQVQDEKALLLERFGLSDTSDTADLEVHAPMPGLVLTVMVAPGEAVRAGDGLLVLEAMKMENELRALTDGVVKAIHVAPGDAVGKNTLLLEFEP